jgi:hypothetical protein
VGTGVLDVAALALVEADAEDGLDAAVVLAVREHGGVELGVEGPNGQPTRSDVSVVVTTAPGRV